MTADDFDQFLRRRSVGSTGHRPTLPRAAGGSVRIAAGSRATTAFFCGGGRRWLWPGGKPRRTCAAELGIDIHTAGRLYAEMEEQLVGHFAVLLSDVWSRECRAVPPC